MEYLNGYAEQYKDWSDCFPAGLDCHVAHAAAYDRQALTCPHPAGDTRIIDHTVHGCGKPRCRCVTGRGHGPKYYLSVSKAGKRPHLIYISQATVAQVREQLSHLRTFRALLEELCDIACELLTRRAGK